MFRRGPKAKILMLIDWMNLSISIDLPSLERYSLIEGFDTAVKQIARDAGEIINVFVFMPPQPAYLTAEDMHKLGFFTIVCPTIRTKERVERDTTDDILIEFGKKMINQIPDLTHLCLGSGDIDFTPLIREAIRKGLKIIILAGNSKSLSRKLVNLVDSKTDGQKMIYILSPITQE